MFVNILYKYNQCLFKLYNNLSRYVIKIKIWSIQQQNEWITNLFTKKKEINGRRNKNWMNNIKINLENQTFQNN